MLEHFDKEISQRAMSEEEVYRCLRNHFDLNCRLVNGLKNEASRIQVENQEEFKSIRLLSMHSETIEELFDISLSHNDFAAIHNTKELCRLIAERTHVYEFIKGTGGVTECDKACVFITIRAILRSCGMNVANIAPSTSLDSVEPYFKLRLAIELERMLSNSPMPYRSIYRRSFATYCLVFISIASFVFSLFMLSMQQMSIGIVIGVFSLISILLLNWFPLVLFDIRFTDIVTFKELANSIAKGRQEDVYELR